MKHTLTRLLLVAALTATLTPAQTPQQTNPPAKAPPPQDQQPRIIVPVDVVSVVFTVVSRRNKFVTDLNKEDFKVLDDGKEREITNFSRETDLPLRIGLLLDTSNSIRDRLQFEKDAAVDFLHSVVRRGKDQAFLMTFDAEPAVIQRFTDDLNTLQEQIQRLRAGGGTSLYDAIHYSSDSLMANPPLPKGDNPEVRRVLVVISDGQDNQSLRARSEALDAAQRAGVVVYTVSTNTSGISPTTRQKTYRDENDKVLEYFAEETGGRVFFPYKMDDLAQSFLDIGSELRSQYSLGFKPGSTVPDGRFHKIQIEVNRKGLNIRARKGYYIPKLTPAATTPTSGVEKK